MARKQTTQQVGESTNAKAVAGEKERADDSEGGEKDDAKESGRRSKTAQDEGHDRLVRNNVQG